MKTPTFLLAVMLSSAPFGVAADYIQDFAGIADFTTDLGDGTVLIGNANGTPQVIGEQLRLTENTNSNNAAFHIPALTESAAGFQITFDLTMTDNTGNPPADGIAFSYGAIPFGTNSPLPEEGWPGTNDVISFELDTWDGATDWGPAIGLNRPANVGALGGSGHSSSLAFTKGQILADEASVSSQVTISYDRGLGFSFSTTNFVTNADFENIWIPNFKGDDTFTFAVAGRTGGANEEVLIDNLSIVAGVDDQDMDGMSDDYEDFYGLDGTLPSGATGDDGPDGDPDLDNLTNIEEHEMGTNPTNANTDGDNLDDGLEAAAGRDPRVADDPPLIVSYSQDFDAFADGTTDLGDGTTIASSIIDAATPGVAQVLGMALQLTADDVNTQLASFRIPALADTQLGWQATFDYTMTDLAGGNPPADGFSFSWGAIPDHDPAYGNGINGTTGHGLAEEGWGAIDHISYEFDTWQPGNPNSDRGVNIASNNPDNTGGDHAFTPGDLFADGETVTGTATIAWSPDFGASFITTGLTTNADFLLVDVPGFTGSQDYVFAFSTRTGGANEQLLIDNIEIASVDPDGDNDTLADVWEDVYGIDTTDDGTTDITNGPAGDEDGDTLTNFEEQGFGTDPTEPDTDGDTINDDLELAGFEARPPTDPTTADTDGDGLTDLEETNTGTFASATDTGTDPTVFDTDGDAFPDGFEITEGSDPNSSTSFPGALGGATYEQNFAGFADGTTDLGDGTTIGSNNGTTQVVSEALRLTANGVGSTRGSFRIPAIEGSSEGWTATFDVTLNGGNPPADGFSFNYGDIQELTTTEAGPTGHGNAEAGMGGSEFFYQFDTYNNNDTANTPGVGIQDRTAATELARVNGIIVPNNGSVTASVAIIWTPTETTFVTSGLTNDAAFFNIPHVFVGSDDFSWAISSRTGGATEDLIIDNLVITVAGAATGPKITDVVYSIDPADGLADITITWTSRADRFYTVYATKGFLPVGTMPFTEAWEDIDDGIEGEEISTTYTEFNIPLGTKERFYRVEEQELNF